MTQFYCYSGSVEGPFYDTREEAAEHCDEHETPRPIDDSVVGSFDDIVDVEGGVVESDDSGHEPDDDNYADWSHDELKAEAEERGIADEIDLRSKDAIVQALED